MLSEISIENFKAFGAKSHIPLAPITLIYGPNSSGKSSIIQSILLLKQTIESRNSGQILLPRLENGIVDLGSFQEMVFDHNLENTMSIRVAPKPYMSNKLFEKIGAFSLEFSFRRRTQKEEISIARISIWSNSTRSYVAHYEVSPEKPNSSKIFSMRAGAVVNSNITHCAICTYLTTEPRFWHDSFEYVRKNKKNILSHLEMMLKDIERKGPHFRKLFIFGRPDKANNSEKYWSDLINKFIDMIKTEFSIEEWAIFSAQIFKKSPIYLSGLLPSGGDPSFDVYDTLIQFDTEKRQSSILDISNIIFPNPSTIAISGAIDLSQRISEVFPLGPFRKAPARYYVFTGTSPTDVGYSGKAMPDLLLRNPKLLKRVNHWLDKLEVGYQLRVKKLGKDKDLFEMRLIDTIRGNKVDIGLTDVGYGISQILPFVVQSFARNNHIIAIEQPEVHIHPRLQADIGDMILESSRLPIGNQFIIETHSEHLILRMLRLIRDGRLKPNMLSVLFVERTKEGSKVKPIRIAEDGGLIDEWPGGFFPERLREI
ncbi:DUF3696 domain-containing protein [Azospirillum sp. B4]|uniref:DUF3696 domain-containing protein n=1 Tax=Azospirillum sp. B4 TaxID=95605 RepID=UPI00034BC46F|nr:DUF3696 domain-containing protein [Azospirillum sp. B4]